MHLLSFSQYLRFSVRLLAHFRQKDTFSRCVREVSLPSKFRKIVLNLLMDLFDDDLHQEIRWEDIISVLHKEILKYSLSRGRHN